MPNQTQPSKSDQPNSGLGDGYRISPDTQKKVGYLSLIGAIVYSVTSSVSAVAKRASDVASNAAKVANDLAVAVNGAESMGIKLRPSDFYFIGASVTRVLLNPGAQWADNKLGWDTSTALEKFTEYDLRLLQSISPSEWASAADLYVKVASLQPDGCKTARFTSAEIDFLKKITEAEKLPDQKAKLKGISWVCFGTAAWGVSNGIALVSDPIGFGIQKTVSVAGRWAVNTGMDYAGVAKSTQDGGTPMIRFFADAVVDTAAVVASQSSTVRNGVRAAGAKVGGGVQTACVKLGVSDAKLSNFSAQWSSGFNRLQESSLMEPFASPLVAEEKKLFREMQLGTSNVMQNAINSGSHETGNALLHGASSRLGFFANAAKKSARYSVDIGKILLLRTLVGPDLLALTSANNSGQERNSDVGVYVSNWGLSAVMACQVATYLAGVLEGALEETWRIKRNRQNSQPSSTIPLPSRAPLI